MVTAALVTVFYSLITILAVYYSLVVNDGFTFGGFLLSLIFSPIYLAYGMYKVGVPPRRNLT
jgi:hypothetical protein